MTPRDFCVWLKGVLETNPTPNEKQLKMVREKLDSIFEHETKTPPKKPEVTYRC